MRCPFIVRLPASQMPPVDRACRSPFPTHGVTTVECLAMALRKSSGSRGWRRGDQKNGNVSRGQSVSRASEGVLSGMRLMIQLK